MRCKLDKSPPEDVIPASKKLAGIFFFKLSILFDTRERHPQPEQKQSTALFAVQGEAVVFEMDCFCKRSFLSAESGQVSR